jgi:RNA polymerase sigma-70 factor (ECF subfamily)
VRGSAKHFERLYQEHFDVIYRYVARRLPPGQRDEVVAETFVTAWRKFATTDDPSLPWLVRLASTEITQNQRRAEQHAEDLAMRDLNMSDRHGLDTVAEFSSAFSQLSSEDAELLRLVHWDHLSRVEIAELYGCPVATINVRYHRAKSRLLGAMNHSGQESDDEITVIAEESEITA